MQRRGRPRLIDIARSERIRKGLTQQDVATRIGKSQAYVSQLEKGLLGPGELREYRNAIAQAPSQERTSGGVFKAGRAKRRSEGLVDPATFRGEPLKRGFDYNAALPPGHIWKIHAICRTSAKSELAFLVQKDEYEEDRVVFGIVGFHLVGNEVKRSHIIRITEEFDETASAALVAFAEEISPHMNVDDLDDESDDDAFVSDDED